MTFKKGFAIASLYHLEDGLVTILMSVAGCDDPSDNWRQATFDINLAS